MNDNKFYRILAPILVVFAGIRIAFLNSLFETAIVKYLVLDSDWYLRWGGSLALGYGHPQGPFWVGPGYPLALAGLFKAAGSVTITLVPLAQFLLSIITIILLTLTVRRLLGDAAAFVTAAIAALYAPWIYYDGMILSASWILFLNSLLLYLLLVRTNLVDDEPHEDNKQLFTWGLAGLVCGASALARPSILIFAVLLIIAVLWMKRLPRRFLKLAVFSIMIVAVHIPILVRNWRVEGSIAFATSSGGINFYIGNRDGASGFYDDAPWLTSSDVFRESEGYRKEAEARTGETMTLDQASGYWADTALREIFQNKTGWLKLMGRKLWLVLRSEELANNFSFNATQILVPFLQYIPLQWGLLLPFSMAGLVLLWPRRKKFWPLGLYALGYIATNIIFFVSSEYRFPLILILLPLAAYFLVSIWKLLEIKSWSKIGFAVIVYMLTLLIANWPSTSLRQAASPAVDYHNLGSIAALYGNDLDALRFYTRALILDDSHPGTRVGLADALWNLGSFDEARKEYELAGVDPPDALSGSPADSLIAELDSVVAADNIPGALAVLDSVAPGGKPAPTEILEYKARLLFHQKQYAEAYSTVIQAKQMEPNSPLWPYLAAEYILETGDAYHADSLYQESIKLHRAFAPARIGRAFLAVETGNIKKARQELDELQKIAIPDEGEQAKVDSLQKLLDYISGNN